MKYSVETQLNSPCSLLDYVMLFPMKSGKDFQEEVNHFRMFVRVEATVGVQDWNQ